MTFRHIVLFRIHDETSSETVDAALAALRRLAGVPGVLECRVELSLDTRKGLIIAESVLFEHGGQVEAFRVHPLHQEAVSMMAGISDWWVGDYVE